MQINNILCLIKLGLGDMGVSAHIFKTCAVDGILSQYTLKKCVT